MQKSRPKNLVASKGKLERASELACPEGHQLPHYNDSGMQCTPVYCAGSSEVDAPAPLPPPKTPRAPKGTKALIAEVAANPMLAGVADESEVQAAYAEARKKHTLRLAHHEAWKDVIPIPAGLKGADAEKWADERLIELLPQAVADLERDLKFGSDDQRAKARDKVLDATGRGKTDKAYGGSAPIIMLNMSPADIPWLKREKKPEQQVLIGEAT